MGGVERGEDREEWSGVREKEVESELVVDGIKR